jgi:hypothetical protein
LRDEAAVAVGDQPLAIAHDVCSDAGNQAARGDASFRDTQAATALDGVDVERGDAGTGHAAVRILRERRAMRELLARVASR